MACGPDAFLPLGSERVGGEAERGGMQPRYCWPRAVGSCVLVMAFIGLTFWKTGSAVHAAETLTEQLLQEPAASVIADARASGDAVRGAVLFADRTLGCAVCHNAGAADRLAPDLRKLARTVTDSSLLESLLEPSREITKGFELSVVQTVDGKVLPVRVVDEREGMLVARSSEPPYEQLSIPLADIEERSLSTTSPMPAGLANQLQSRQDFLDLLRYLFELRDRGGEEPLVAAVASGGSVPDHVQGAVLYDRLGCRSCHGDTKWQALTTGSVSPDRAPLLTNVRARFRPDELMRYLADPHAAKPGSRMPHVLAGERADTREQIALELTHYLLARGEEAFVSEATDAERAARGREIFQRVGCVACHTPQDADGKQRLQETSVPLDGMAERWSLPALVAFLENPTSVRPGGRMPDMHLSHEEAVDLAHTLIGERSGEARGDQPWSVEESLARAGEGHYQRLRCNTCHEPEETPSVAEVAIRESQRGCLSQGRGAWPLYTLTDEQRRLLVAFCSSDVTPEPEPIVSVMATLRCYACHQRDGIGGVDADRDSYFTTTDFNLGQQGRLPPHLDAVGNKLRPQWLRQVLVSGRSVRPYMHTRMPRFGLPQVEPLVGLLTEVDDRPDTIVPPTADLKPLREAGHELAGVKGLNCIACHTFQRTPAATMSAVDLTEMAERLQRDWFVEYLLHPQRLSPGTVMPSFWPGGKAVRDAILEGDTARQLEALWIYLEDGRQARAPQGQVVEPLRLVATEEAVMLRRSWPGVGKRGIGVGYPEQVNLVFDAEQMRLAMLWKGEFADPGGVWRSQGHGSVRPLGGPVRTVGEGPDITNPDNPWVVTEAERRPPGFRFLGYELDAARRPRFRYQADGVVVEEAFRGTAEQTLVRTVLLTGNDVDGSRTYRLLAGTTIEQTGENRWQSDSGLQLTLAMPAPRAEIKAAEGGQQLQVPLPTGTFKLSLEMEYAW